MSLSSHSSAKQESLVLIAEDDAEIAEILAAYLQRSGMRSVHALDGRDALAKHHTLKPDLVLLDIQMPLMDGWQVLSEIRHQSNTPVIMLTALDQDIDKLTGLRIGADDYVVKPFNPAEVTARVMAVLRRAKNSNVIENPLLKVGPLQVDLDSHEAFVSIDGRTHLLDLTLTEFNILTYLMRSPRRVVSRAELLEACLPEGDTLERTVDSHVSKLRKKLDRLSIQGIPVCVRGVGYRLGSEE